MHGDGLRRKNCLQSVGDGLWTSRRFRKRGVGDAAPYEKAKGLEKSAFGVVGIETAFQILHTYLVKPGILSMEKLVQLLCDNPRNRFHLPLGCDYSIWDLEAEETVDPEVFLSMGKATPFEGWKVNGKCMATVCGGKIVYRV